jgi:hypothetical protein
MTSQSTVLLFKVLPFCVSKVFVGRCPINVQWEETGGKEEDREGKKSVKWTMDKQSGFA